MSLLTRHDMSRLCQGYELQPDVAAHSLSPALDTPRGKAIPGCIAFQVTGNALLSAYDRGGHWRCQSLSCIFVGGLQQSNPMVLRCRRFYRRDGKRQTSAECCDLQQAPELSFLVAMLENSLPGSGLIESLSRGTIISCCERGRAWQQALQDWDLPMVGFEAMA